MEHYSAKRWFTLVFRFRGSVVPALVWRTALATALGGVALWLHRQYGFHLPPLAHTMLGVALGLLLVFRTNSAYDRFWEGRRLVGLMVNRSRDLMRQATSYIDGDDEEAARSRAELRRHINLLYALIRQFLRGERDLALLGDAITPAERRALEGVAVRPCVAFTWISLELARCARAGRLTEQRLQAMDANLTSFSDSWGGAERIMKTPIPFAYAHHIKAFLLIFAFSAPFAMVEAMHWFTPASSAVLAYALFGIDEIGVEIEDPFGYDPNDIPLDSVGESIRRDLGDIAAAGQSGSNTALQLDQSI
jgi:putative membrane protein